MFAQLFKMKLFVKILCVLILSMNTCCKNRHVVYDDFSNSSGFNLKQLDSTALSNLVVLGRVWGFVKYHHPILCDNKYDIDFELFNLLPQIANSQPEARNQILSEWIDHFGEYKVSEPTLDFDTTNISETYQLDHSWIKDTATLGPALSDRLIRLRNADRTEDNFYVAKTFYKEYNSESYNPSFQNEKSYDELVNPDYGYRLLAVFRFWNMIEYFFPTKYLTDKPWNEVLPAYIGRMVQPIDGDYRKEAWRMIAEINDSHADTGEVAFELFGKYRVPLHCAFVQGKLLISKLDTIEKSINNGIRIGDEIIAVDGKPVQYFIDQVKTYIPCSNDSRVGDWTAEIIFRTTKNTKKSIHYLRDGIIRDTMADIKAIPYYYNISSESVSYKEFDEDIIYVNPFTYTSEDKEVLIRLLSHANFTIIDYRLGLSNDYNVDFDGNLSGLLSQDNLDSTRVAYYYTYPSVKNPGVFHASSKPQLSQPPMSLDKIKIIVLVGSWTQSTTETYVQCLQIRDDVMVIGSQSAGADGNVSPICLPGGIKTCFSGLGWYYPDGWCVQRQGVKIDYEVLPTTEGVKAGRDEPLEAAIKTIKNQMIPNILKNRELKR